MPGILSKLFGSSDKAYDYYYVSIPEDMGDEAEQGQAAIREAQERARLYASPCEWRANKTRRKGWNGPVWKVTRIRHKTPKKAAK